MFTSSYLFYSCLCFLCVPSHYSLKPRPYSLLCSRMTTHSQTHLPVSLLTTPTHHPIPPLHPTPSHHSTQTPTTTPPEPRPPNHPNPDHHPCRDYLIWPHWCRTFDEKVIPSLTTFCTFFAVPCKELPTVQHLALQLQKMQTV